MSIYLNCTDLPGSCDKDAHKEWMELESFGHGVDRPYAVGGQWDPADVHDFIFTKKSDIPYREEICPIRSSICSELRTTYFSFSNRIF